MKKIITCLITGLIVAGCQNANIPDFQTTDTNLVQSNAVLNPLDIKELKDNRASLSGFNSGALVATLTGPELDLKKNVHKVNISVSGNNTANELSQEFAAPAQPPRHPDREGKTALDNQKESRSINEAYRTGSLRKSLSSLFRNTMLSEGATRVFKLRNEKNGTAQDRPAVLKKISKSAYFWISKAELPEIDYDLLMDSVNYWESTAYPIITSRFGNPPMPPNDVDGEARINIFIDKLSDKDEGLYGYFDQTDVIPEKNEEEISNHTDMLYLNSWLFKRAETKGHYAKSTLIHEFQHLVNFNMKVTQRLKKGLAPVDEQRWLDEGLSVYAEQLGGFGLPFGDPFCVDYLEDFFNDPGKFTVITEDDGLNYGAEYLLILYLAEQYGPDLIKKLVASDKAGIENVEAITHTPFKKTFTDWATAMLLSGSGKNPRFDFKSVNLHKQYGDKVLDGINLNKVISRFPSQTNIPMNDWTVNYVKLDNIKISY
jgi:hypothetical protein